MIQQRIARESTFVMHRSPLFPLEELELAFISTIIQMCRIYKYFTATEGLALVHTMIDGPNAQKKLVDLKNSNKYNTNPEDLGHVGLGYWSGFVYRSGRNICRK